MHCALTGGKYPFKSNAEITERKAPNFKELRSSKFDAKITQETIITVVDMTKRMIDHEPTKRLTVDEVLCHPTFYSDQEKLNFLLKVHESVKNWKSTCLDLDKLHHFDGGLLNDNDVGNSKKFQLSETKIFKDHEYFFKEANETKNIGNENNKNKKRNNWVLLRDIANVNGLLKALRDKIAHACDGPCNVPLQFVKDFDVTEDSYSPRKFLEVFLSQCPQLLIHLYELYRNTKLAAEFYPAAKQEL